MPELPQPHIVNLHKGKPYDYTYTVNKKLIYPDIHEELLQSAKFIYRMKVTDRLLLLSGLIDHDISSETVHYLFSYYQFCFDCISGKPDTAMYAPLGDLSEYGSPFPLHSDLYVQKMLMIVFDNVPLDDTGQTLLISTENFLMIICSLTTMPEEAKEYITRLLTDNNLKDRFNEFFDLLYDEKAPWLGELFKALESQQLMVKFLSGEGFLLHDRLWLHGRTAPSCGIHEDRLHRLTFNNAEVS